MARTAVGVLRGGTSGEYDLSLKTGGAILAALPEDKYETRDILIDKSGMWHLRGTPATPSRALAQVDVVLNALHGGVGEDGTVQRLLDTMGIPYAGSRARASGHSLHKVRAREAFRNAGLPIARGISFSSDNPMTAEDMARAIFAQFGPPYIVKPVSDGAGRGIQIATTILDLPDVLASVLDAYGAALVEEYLDGEDVTVGIIELYRGEDVYALPPVHIELPEGDLHIHYDHHEQGLLHHNVPSDFSHEEKNLLMDIARAAHRALNLSHFSSADFRLTRRGPVLLEVDAYPGLYKGAALPPMLESVGSSTREFLEHAIQLALR